jgi:hypothetical protein
MDKNHIKEKYDDTKQIVRLDFVIFNINNNIKIRYKNLLKCLNLLTIDKNEIKYKFI